MNNQKTVLVVEDNIAMLTANIRVLREAGHVTRAATTLVEARAHLEDTRVDVVVLDIMLPDGNGLDFIEEIRQYSSMPVLLLTSLTGKNDKLTGLRVGGDDYITKPYDLDELVARVEAFLRRENMCQKDGNRPIVYGSLKLDMLADRAYLHEEDILLTQKEFAILAKFLQSEGKVITAQKLYETVWKQPFFCDNQALKSTISRLRKKLAGHFVVIVKRGIGYQLEAKK